MQRKAALAEDGLQSRDKQGRDAAQRFNKAACVENHICHRVIEIVADVRVTDFEPDPPGQSNHARLPETCMAVDSRLNQRLCGPGPCLVGIQMLLWKMQLPADAPEWMTFRKNSLQPQGPCLWAQTAAWGPRQQRSPSAQRTEPGSAARSREPRPCPRARSLRAVEEHKKRAWKREDGGWRQPRSAQSLLQDTSTGLASVLGKVREEVPLGFSTGWWESLSSLQHWAQGLNPWNSMRKNPTPVVPAHAALRDNVTTQQEVPKKRMVIRSCLCCRSSQECPSLETSR